MFELYRKARAKGRAKDGVEMKLELKCKSMCVDCKSREQECKPAHEFFSDEALLTSNRVAVDELTKGIEKEEERVKEIEKYLDKKRRCHFRPDCPNREWE